MTARGIRGASPLLGATGAGREEAVNGATGGTP